MTKSSSVPTHLGLILDGNRRWAKHKGLAPLEGHRRGYEVLETIGLAALERGIKYISVYVFSTENWQRSASEVNYLMNLVVWVVKNKLDDLHKKNVKVRFVGSTEGVKPAIMKLIDQAEEKTKNNTAGTFAVCFNYGGQQEIADSVKKIIEQAVPANKVTTETVASNLYAPDIPPVDMVVRTSGEKRLSNFMLWRTAYSELIFLDKYWPDFTVADLDEAIAEFNRRQRRFGY